MARARTRECVITLRRRHARQQEIKASTAKRKIVRAGRRGGKTVEAATSAVEGFLDGRRVLYAAPVIDQVEAFWGEVARALAEPISMGVYRKNETLHLIEQRGGEGRIRAKTAWNADSLRGDFADLLILDEYQLMNEDAWGRVGAPMLLDNNGDAMFIYTPPSLRSRSTSKAHDPQHAAKLFKKAQKDTSGRWAAFTFPSHDNPHVSAEALGELSDDMTALAYRQEILAEDVDEVPGALWTRAIIEQGRVEKAPEQLARIVVGVDPTGTADGDEAGIVVVGMLAGGRDFFVLADDSLHGSPERWAAMAVRAYHRDQCDRLVAESNFGGEMVRVTIKTVDTAVPVKLVNASRGKAVRAEPISALYEQGRVHHVGSFPKLEDEQCLWLPGDKSPNRMDALVFAVTELIRKPEQRKAQTF